MNIYCYIIDTNIYTGKKNDLPMVAPLYSTVDWATSFLGYKYMSRCWESTVVANWSLVMRAGRSLATNVSWKAKTFCKSDSRYSKVLAILAGLLGSNNNNKNNNNDNDLSYWLL